MTDHIRQKFLLPDAGGVQRVAALWRIVKAEPYARCRSKTPPVCRGRASPGCKGSVLPDPRQSLVGPGQSLVGSRMKCRVRRGETSSGQGRSALVGPGRQPWPSCLSMRQTVLGITCRFLQVKCTASPQKSQTIF